MLNVAAQGQRSVSGSTMEWATIQAGGRPMIAWGESANPRNEAEDKYQAPEGRHIPSKRENLQAIRGRPGDLFAGAGCVPINRTTQIKPSRHSQQGWNGNFHRIVHPGDGICRPSGARGFFTSRSWGSRTHPRLSHIAPSGLRSPDYVLICERSHSRKAPQNNRLERADDRRSAGYRSAVAMSTIRI